MKIPMQRSPRERRCRRLAAAALTLPMLASSCRATSLVGGEMRNHPAQLVGEWVDSAESTAADTALWILSASGEDASQHLRPRPDGTFARSAARHYGYWFLQGALADAARRAICFTNRPGRSAATCLPFDIDSTPGAPMARRRLLVRGYQGAHHTADRVLLARRP
jgi:hypothetical protein